MTAARASAPEAAPLSSLFEREVSAHAHDAVVAPLLDAALHAPLREFLSRPGKEFRARLCELAYRLGGGRPGELPPELPLVVELLHAGSLVVDDIEDDSDARRGRPALHRLFGVPVALNAGNWLYFWPQRLVARAGLAPATRLAMHERMGECLLRCHEGQALDLTVRVAALPQGDVPAAVRAAAERKTGALMGFACALGALAADADAARVAALERFGCELGVGLQMLDDLSGVLNPARADKGAEDLHAQRATWVWALLARDLPAGEYRELVEQLRWAGEAAPDADARTATLIERLRFRLGVPGVRRARRHLERSVAALAVAVGDGPWRRAVEDELRWLERRFLEARP